MRRTGTRQGSAPDRQGLFRGRQRLLAWAAFGLLAAYAPVMAWLTGDDSWLLPVAVAGMVGYALIVDDHLRRRARAHAAPPITDPPTTTASIKALSTNAPSIEDVDRGRPVDGPEPVSDDMSSMDVSSNDQRPDR